MKASLKVFSKHQATLGSTMDEGDAPIQEEERDTEKKECIEALEIYQLDYERQPIASGGEVLQKGDHIYMWCTLYQHHGIVLETDTWNNSPSIDKSDQDVASEKSILIAEFTNVALLGTADDHFQSTSTASGAVSAGVAGGFRFVKERSPEKWHVVKYGANLLEMTTWRPGTCSAAIPSPLQTILMRVQFLNDCRHWIPDYHVLACNCETVAVWCITGKWETLQGGRALQVSQLTAVATVGVLPMMAGIGLAAGGLSMWHSHQINRKWRETAARLNKEFQWYAMGKTPDFRFMQSPPTTT